MIFEVVRISESVNKLILGYLRKYGASYHKDIHRYVQEKRPETPEHSVRGRLSEMTLEGITERVDKGWYDLKALYSEDKGMTSVVSYPDRCNLWGDNRYRGNCDGRLFKNLVLRYKARKVADPMMGSGTTKDVVEGLNKHRGMNIEYHGSDLRHGFNLLRDDFKHKYDFVWVHFPYHDMIRYSNHPEDLSNCRTYEDFKDKLKVCVKKCHDALLPGGRLAILIGDLRRKGRYYPIFNDIINFGIGELKSLIIKVQHNCHSDKIDYGYLEDVPIKHEYCLVFKKSD